MIRSNFPAYLTRHSTPRERSIQRRLLWPLVTLVILIVIASAGYCILEPRYTWLDAVYMTMISMTTVGYREVHELSPAGQIWSMFIIVAGLMVGAVVLSLIGGMIVEGKVRRIFGRRQLQRKIATLSGHVIMCGYGRTGAFVADDLTEAGHQVVVVEADPDRTALAEQAGLLYVRGDAQEEDVLEAAGVERAKILIAALRTDADNVFVTLSARQANASLRIVARAKQEASRKKLLHAGASGVVCAQTISARRISGLVLRPAVIELMDMAREGLDLDVSQLEIDAGSPLAGKTLAELELPRRTGAHIVAIRKADGRAAYAPGPETQLEAADTLVFIGELGSSQAIEAMTKKAQKTSGSG
ncbi:MAG: potassium channel family protein [Planctomycetota bacterium]|jgi:voltage-gated potassium channel